MVATIYISDILALTSHVQSDIVLTASAALPPFFNISVPW